MIAMETSKRRFNLVPLGLGISPIIEEKLITARLNPKVGGIYFGKDAVTEMALESHWYRLFYDIENCVIAWQVTDNLTKEQMESKVWKVSKVNASGIILFSVSRILKAMNYLSEQSKRFEVKKYEPKGGLQEPGNYYFIELGTPLEDKKKDNE